MFSIQIASTGPSNITHWRSGTSFRAQERTRSASTPSCERLCNGLRGIGRGGEGGGIVGQYFHLAGKVSTGCGKRRRGWVRKRSQRSVGKRGGRWPSYHPWPQCAGPFAYMQRRDGPRRIFTDQAGGGGYKVATDVGSGVGWGAGAISVSWRFRHSKIARGWTDTYFQGSKWQYGVKNVLKCGHDCILDHSAPWYLKIRHVPPGVA